MKKDNKYSSGKKILMNLIRSFKDTIQKMMSISVKESEMKLNIMVTNQGSPIDKESLEKIFYIYFKDDNSRGAGLGLFITKKIAEMLDGDVEVQCNNGATTFTLWFPIDNKL